MKKQTYLSSLLVLSLFASSSATAAFDQYTVTDLGSLDPGSANDFSYAFDINDRGDIVGFSTGSDGLAHAFVRFRGQSLNDLGQGRATSINNRRQLVGWGAGPNYLLWNEDAAGNWVSQDIGVTTNSRHGQTVKINDRGHIAGVSFNATTYEFPVFFWKDGVASYLGFAGGCIPLSVVGFNNYDDILSGDSSSMYIYQGNTGQQRLLGDGSFAELNAWNDVGDAVGRNYVNQLNAQGSWPGYYSESTGFKVIPENQAIFDINNAGLAVGGGNYGSYNADTTYNPASRNGILKNARAFVYSGAENSVAYLDTLAPNSGWNFKIATGINGSGQIIGFGINPEGKPHAFLLTPVTQP